MNRRSDSLLSLFVPGLMLAVPFVGTVRQVHHPVTDPDSVAGIAILFAIGALAGLLVWRGGRARLFTLAALLTVTLDLLLKGAALSHFLPQRLFVIPIEPVLVVAGFILALAVCYLLRAELLRILAAGFAVAMVAALVGPIGGAAIGRSSGKASSVSSAAPPLLVHLILDEHIGIDGIPTDVPGGRELQRTLAAFYEEFGFRFYSRSFSPYIDTRDSLPNLFNFTRRDVVGAFLAEPKKLFEPPYVMARNDYFDRLAALGYRIHAYESTFLDICRAPAAVIADCYVYPQWGFESARGDLGLSARLRLLSTAYVQDSLVYRTAKTDTLRRLGQGVPAASTWERSLRWERAQTGPLTSLSTLQMLEEELMTATRGEAYVAHLLMPHNPYVYDADCVVRDPADWQPVEGAGYQPLTDVERHRLNEGYFGQMSCLYKHLRRIFLRLRDSGRLNDAIVIVHGDHGSRIAEPRHSLWTREDYLAMYSTIYAVKAPGIRPGRDDSSHSVHHLLAEQWTGRSAVDSPVVYVPKDTDPARLQSQLITDLGWQ